MEEQVRLLGEWLVRARRGQHSQHNAGKCFAAFSGTLSFLAIGIPAVIGAIALSLLGRNVSESMKVVFAAAGALTAVVSALQVSLRYSERAKEHAQSGAEYGVIRRKIEAFLCTEATAEGTRTFLDEVRAELDILGRRGPVVSGFLWKATLKEIEGTKQFRAPSIAHISDSSAEGEPEA